MGMGSINSSFFQPFFYAAVFLRLLLLTNRFVRGSAAMSAML
jgi:hypothetical protein